MKKTWIVISILVFCLVGCSDKTVVKEPKDTERVEKSKDTVKDHAKGEAKDKTDKADTKTDVSAKEAPIQSEHRLEQNEVKTANERPKIESPKKGTVTEKHSKTVEKEETVTESQNTFVAYSPQTVVALATSKTKGYRKITLTENLDKLLSEGAITKEEYDEYYPYDGAGYYSVFVETNLCEAKTTSGRLLETEEGIAQYIADMLVVESGPYFLIEYVGIYSTGSSDFYEFRCYRA